MNAAKPIETKPLTGPLDFRTPVDELSQEDFRWRENFACNDEGKIIRAKGFSQFLSGNADYHDQLLPLQNFYAYQSPRVGGDDAVTPLPNDSYCTGQIQTQPNGREPVIFSFGLRTQSAGSRLLIGTPSRLLTLDRVTQNYQIIADGQGATQMPMRWHADVLNDTVILTNGIDQPLSWVIDSQPVGCELQAAQPISDGVVVGLERVGFVKQFDGVMLYLDCTLNGVRFPNMILWSDEDLPQSLNPANNNGASVAGFFNLPPGHTILGAEVFGSAIYIFTDKGICRGVPTGTTPIFDFSQFVYSDDSGNRCIAYPNTLCAYGINFFYAGLDGFYVWNPYEAEPQRPDWMHKASGVVYNGAGGYLPMDPSLCEVHHAFFKPNPGRNTADGTPTGEGEIWMSYAEQGQILPSKTIVLNTEFQVASTLDHGFGCFTEYVEDDTISFRDFLLQSCISTAESLAYLGIPFVKEGQPQLANDPKAECYTPPPTTTTTPEPMKTTFSTCVILPQGVTEWTFTGLFIPFSPSFGIPTITLASENAQAFTPRIIGTATQDGCTVDLGGTTDRADYQLCVQFVLQDSPSP